MKKASDFHNVIDDRWIDGWIEIASFSLVYQKNVSQYRSQAQFNWLLDLIDRLGRQKLPFSARCCKICPDSLFLKAQMPRENVQYAASLTAAAEANSSGCISHKTSLRSFIHCRVTLHFTHRPCCRCRMMKKKKKEKSFLPPSSKSLLFPTELTPWVCYY